MTTYAEFQDKAASEKIGLVILEACRRLVGWELESGSVYKIIEFPHQVITEITEAGVALSAGSSSSLSAGQYYLDRQARVLYLRTTASANPNSVFIACTFQNFFANTPVSAPHDVDDATSFQVYWEPMLRSETQYGVELDNANLMGFAIEGSGRISFHNEQEFWKPVFDKWVFDNQRCWVYSWNRDLAITEAKIVYRGRVQSKKYTTTVVEFQLKDLINELRAPVPLTDLSEYTGALIPPSLLTAKQRAVYGYVRGHRPTSIDQELPLTGYEISGTASVTAASATVTGSGTTFLSRFSPGDEVRFGDDDEKYAVSSVASDTSMTLTEVYAGTTGSGKTISIFADLPKRYMNRILLIAGHAIKQPATTIDYAITTSLFNLVSAEDILVGDKIFINGETLEVSRVSGNRIKTTTALALLPSAGDSVTVLSVYDVYLNNRKLEYSRDYTYDPDTALMTLDGLAEFNVAPVRPLAGTSAFTSGSRSVTGTNTFYKAEVKPGDWIKRSSQSSWFEVLSVESDTALTLKSNASYTSSGATDLKTPEIFDDKEVLLSCSCLGATENGTSTGVFIKTASKIVEYLLRSSGIGTDMLDVASFDDAEADSTHKLGVVIPATMADTKSPTLRDVINKINQSVLGSLYQNADFEFAYSILSPRRDTSSVTKFTERDVLGFTIESDISKIVKTCRVRHLNKEVDPESGAQSFAEVQKVSDVATYLSGSTKEQIVETYLIDSEQAQMLCNRWGFLLELASSVLSVDTKMQGSRISVNDRIEISHEKLYERLGSELSRKVSGVQASRKSPTESSLETADLSNAFTRCAVIAPNSSNTWDEATDDEKIYNGFITDEYGMQSNDADTFGINLIW